MRVTMGCLLRVQDLIYVLLSASAILHPDSKVHGANMGPTWGRQDPGGPHVGPMNFAIWAGIILCMRPANERLTILQLDANFTWSCHNMEMLSPLLPLCLMEVSKQTAEQTIKLPVIWDAMKLIWHQCMSMNWCVCENQSMHHSNNSHYFPHI